jgi:hypothetical protein
VRGFNKRCILRLGRDSIRVIAHAAAAAPSGAGSGGAGSATTGGGGGSFAAAVAGGGATQVWTTSATAEIMEDVRCESASDNLIYLDVPDLGPLVFALRACEKHLAAAANVGVSATAALKLVEAGGRHFLSLTMRGAASAGGGGYGGGGGGGGVDAAHEVPVRLMAEIEVAAVRCPPLESDGVTQFEMPPVVDIAAVTDRMRAARATAVTLTAIMPPQTHHAAAAADPTPPLETLTLRLSADTPGLRMNVAFMGVALHSRPEGVPLGTTHQYATIDIRRLLRFCAVRETGASRVMCHLVHQRAVVFSAYSPGGGTSLVFYVPALAAV